MDTHQSTSCTNPERSEARSVNPAATSARRETGREWEARSAVLLGQRAHRVIALLCERGGSARGGYGTLLEVLDAVNAVCGDLGTRSARERAFRQGVFTAAAVYLRRFKPGPDWHWESAETSAPGARLDLVFRRLGDGAVLVDELKTGSNSGAATAAREQVTRHLAGAADLWGDRFMGVRLLWLTAPSSSQFFPAGGGVAVPLGSSGVGEAS